MLIMPKILWLPMSLSIVWVVHFPLFVVKNGKNGKSHVLALQNMEQDSMQFDLAADSLEELFEWYQVAWDITQREMSKQYHREQEVSISCCTEPWKF